jgi:hypothetical protein
MWFWRRTEKISWTIRVRNEEVLYKVKEERYTTKRRQGGRICDILRRNCLLKYIIEGKIEGGTEVAERQGRNKPATG